MKRHLAVLTAAPLLAATGLAVPAHADASVTVCHATASNAADSTNRYDWYIGHEIQVAENAVPALERRGDVVAPESYSTRHATYMRPGHQWWGALADEDGTLVNADCAFRFVS